MQSDKKKDKKGIKKNCKQKIVVRTHPDKKKGKKKKKDWDKNCIQKQGEDASRTKKIVVEKGLYDGEDAG